MQRGLHATFQDLLRLGSVGHCSRELEGSHHQAEDGRRAAAARCGSGVRKQCGQRRNVAPQPFLVGLPGGQGLAGDFGEQRRRGAPTCRVSEVVAVQVSPDRALEVQARPLFIEAMLLIGERACQRLADERLLGLEVRIECPVGKAGLAHDSGNPGGGDPVSAEAPRRYIDYVPSCRRLMTFFETHRSINSTNIPPPSGCSCFQQGLEVAIKLLGHGIDLIAVQLAKNRCWSIIFKPNTAITILAQQDADGRIEPGRQLMAGHLGCGKRISDIVLDGSARQPSNS
jgi:hypothetical protein